MLKFDFWQIQSVIFSVLVHIQSVCGYFPIIWTRYQKEKVLELISLVKPKIYSTAELAKSQFLYAEIRFLSKSVHYIFCSTAYTECLWLFYHNMDQILQGNGVRTDFIGQT